MESQQRGLATGVKLGPYEILSALGAGGMGEVYKARDTRLDRFVAVKVISKKLGDDSNALARFEREAKAVAALSHPNILSIFDFGQEGDVTYAIMELLEGETLRQRLSSGPLPVSKAKDMAEQIASGLAAAHEKGIVHRDLKPGNIFVTNPGRVKILDFGLARVTDRAAPAGSMAGESQTGEMPTQTGTVLGTPGYMAPEQARGLPADARSDIFSFGAVLYEMLSGMRPFDRGSAADAVAALLKEDAPPLPPATPPGLDRIVKRCLEKRPEDRFSSAHDLTLALQAISGTELASSSDQPALVRGGRFRRIVAITVGIVVVLLAAAGIWLYVLRLRAGKPPAPPPSAGAPSLVALPCKVLGSPESAYLTDAVPSSLSTFLGEVQGIDTKVPPTSFEVEKVHGDLDKIADAYGVQTFVLSTATAEGGHLVFNIQLADARTRKVRWSHQYQGSRENYTAMAREAAQGICKAVLPDASPMGLTPGLSSNSESELAFQQGKYYASRYSGHGDRADFERALEAFNRALALDPKDAATAAWMSSLYVTALAVGHIPRTQGVAEAEAWVQKALVLDPQCSEAWASRAGLEAERPDADMENQIEWSLKAARLGPRNPRAQGSLAIIGLSTGGSASLGVQALREQLRQDPLAFAGYTRLAYLLSELGRPEEALPLVDTELSLDPGNPWALECKAYVLAEMGRTKEAAALLKRLEAGGPSGSNLWVQDVKWLLSLALGNDQEARSSLKAIMATFADPARGWNYLQWDIAFLLPATNRRFGENAALDLLILSTKRGATMPYDMLMLRPDLRELREDPRAKDVIQKTKAPFDMLIRILSEARARGELPKYLEKPMDDLLKQLKEHGAWNG